MAELTTIDRAGMLQTQCADMASAIYVLNTSDVGKNNPKMLEEMLSKFHFLLEATTLVELDNPAFTPTLLNAVRTETICGTMVKMAGEEREQVETVKQRQPFNNAAEYLPAFTAEEQERFEAVKPFIYSYIDIYVLRYLAILKDEVFDDAVIPDAVWDQAVSDKKLFDKTFQKYVNGPLFKYTIRTSMLTAIANLHPGFLNGEDDRKEFMLHTMNDMVGSDASVPENPAQQQQQQQ